MIHFLVHKHPNPSHQQCNIKQIPTMMINYTFINTNFNFSI